jgi:hypothetical protein
MSHPDHLIVKPNETYVRRDFQKASDGDTMVRTVVGYSILAVIGVMAIKLLLGIAGFAFSLLSSLLWLVAIGFLIYLVLKVISPKTASKVKEAINGNNEASE